MYLGTLFPLRLTIHLKRLSGERYHSFGYFIPTKTELLEQRQEQLQTL